MNFSHFAKASALSLANSSTRPTCSAWSVVNMRPCVRANSAWRKGIVFFIVAWNQVGATIPSCVSFRPIVNLGSITRYSQLMASKQPPAGECPLIAAAVGNPDPYNCNQASWKIGTYQYPNYLNIKYLLFYLQCVPELLQSLLRWLVHLHDVQAG